jgi:hypothetical protein
VTKHRCGLTHQYILSHQRALKSARWWSANGRSTIAAPCRGCGGWHIKTVATLALPAVSSSITTLTKERQP